MGRRMIDTEEIRGSAVRIGPMIFVAVRIKSADLDKICRTVGNNIRKLMVRWPADE